MEFKAALLERTKEAEQIVFSFLPKEEGLQKTIFEAMNYSVKAPGKRLRPILMKETYQMFGGKQDAVLHRFMAALEFIHTYSLVHDDLPAMDDDEYRRGRKTTHTVFGEAMGILAGDALLHHAFDTAAGSFLLADADLSQVGRALKILTEKSGICGMVGGQVVDVEMEGKTLTDVQLDFIYRLKTAALLECAMMIGATLAGADEESVARIEAVAKRVGIAFQIQDDILDQVSSTEELGKPVGSDEKNHKMTYAVLHGLRDSEKEVERLSKEAVELLDSFSQEHTFLKELIVSLIHRKK
ncbi:geranylgeranyl diphosphate synthase, type II [Lachnospiraceae bacterium XBB1006]|nr:geranylgeranyl diphosphate synthase, type II [Lachnospiraceae bacterium XBB1006]